MSGPDRSHAARVVAAVLGFLFLGAQGKCGGETSAPTERAYVIFIDLSLSLSGTQTDMLPAVLQSLAHGMPPGSRITVFPIAERTVATGPVFETRLPRADNATERVRLQQARAVLVNQILQGISAMRRTLQNGAALQSTCISDALRQAAKEAGDLRPPGGAGIAELEVVFLSDMLEDCRASLLSGPLSLEKTDIRMELERARALPPQEQLVDLRRARVTMLLPPLALASPKTPRPLEHELESFWRAVLDHCNDDRPAFRFGARVPRRLATYGGT